MSIFESKVPFKSEEEKEIEILEILNELDGTGKIGESVIPLEAFHKLHALDDNWYNYNSIWRNRELGIYSYYIRLLIYSITNKFPVNFNESVKTNLILKDRFSQLDKNSKALLVGQGVEEVYWASNSKCEMTCINIIPHFYSKMAMKHVCKRDDIDNGEEIIQHFSNQKNNYIEKQWQDVDELKGEFDYIVMSQVMHFDTEEEVSKFFDKIDSNLKKDGKILFVSHSTKGEKSEDKKSLWDEDKLQKYIPKGWEVNRVTYNDGDKEVEHEYHVQTFPHEIVFISEITKKGL